MPEIKLLDVEDRWNPDGEDEIEYWPRVEWIDPGVVSGLAVVWFDPAALFRGDPLPRVLLAYSEMFLSGPENGLNGQVSTFLRVRKTLATEPGLAVGCESFVPRQMNTEWAFYSPMRIRAALEYRLSITRPLGQKNIGHGVPLHVQSPSDALTTFNNDRLRALRMYRPGPDHVNDAKRHCLLWIRKLRGQGMDFFKAAHGFEESWFQE